MQHQPQSSATDKIEEWLSPLYVVTFLLELEFSLLSFGSAGGSLYFILHKGPSDKYKF